MPRYAAIDIGSNSIRMEAAELVPGLAARVLASDREVTRLGESVFSSGAVSEEALKATCVVLARMAGIYRKLDVVGVRVVATSAIRDTRNQREFLARAAEAVGAPVEIISGREEARLETFVHMAFKGERRGKDGPPIPRRHPVSTRPWTISGADHRSSRSPAHSGRCAEPRSSRRRRSFLPATSS